MKRLWYSVLTFLSVTCLAMGVLLMAGVGFNVQKANATTGATPTFSKTKYMVSSDGESVLFVTAIGNCGDVYNVEYSITRSPSLTAVNTPTDKYYSSITIGGNTWTTEDLFGAGYTGMVIGEYSGYSDDTAIQVNVSANVGDREGDVLVESATVQNGTEIEPVAVVTGDGTYNKNEWGGYNFYLGTSVDSWQDQRNDKVLQFDYKPDSATNKTWVGLGDGSGWYAKAKLNFNNNTVTEMASNLYTITNLGSGWYRAKIIIKMMAKNTGDGTEALNRVVFYWVTTGFTVKNVKITEYSWWEELNTSLTKASHNTGGGITITALNSVSDWKNSKLLVFNYKALTETNKTWIQVGNGTLYARGKLWFTENPDYVTNGNDGRIGSQYYDIIDLDNGWKQLRLDLTGIPELNDPTGEETLDRVNFCWVGDDVNVGNIHFESYNKWEKFNTSLTEESHNTGGGLTVTATNSISDWKNATLLMKYKVTSDNHNKIWIQAGNGTALYARGKLWFKTTGHYVSSNIDEQAIEHYEITALDNGWYQLSIKLSELVELNDPTGEETLDRVNFCWVGDDVNVADITFEAEELPVLYQVRVVDGTGAGDYNSGDSATVVAASKVGKIFKNWTVGDEVVSTNSSYTFTVTENVRLVANYKDSPYALGAYYSINLPTYSSAKTLEFDLKIESTGSYDKCWMRLAQDNSNYFGPYKFTRSGIATNDATAGAIRVTSNDGNGLLHIVIALDELATKVGNPTKIAKITDNIDWTTGVNGYIDNIKLDNAVSYDVSHNIAASYVINLPDYVATSSAQLEFDLNITSSGGNDKFWLRLDDGTVNNYYGNYKFTSAGVNAASVNTNGLYFNNGHVTIKFNELTGATGTVSKIKRMTDVLSWCSGAEGTVSNIRITYTTAASNSVSYARTVDNTAQILRNEGSLGSNTTLSFAGAKGERETGQLILHATSSIMNKDFSVTFSDFVGEGCVIYGSAVSTYIQIYNNVTTQFVVGTKSGEDMTFGYFPNGLLPLDAATAAGENKLKVSSGNNQGLFFIMNIPTDAKKGTYYGNVIIQVTGYNDIILPVEIEVYGFALPEENANKTEITLSLADMRALYGNNLYDNGDFYVSGWEFLRERGVSGGDVPQSPWASSTMPEYITWLQKVALDPKTSCYVFEYNYDLYDVTVRFRNGLSTKTRTLQDIKLPRFETIVDENSLDRYGVKDIIRILAENSTDDCDLFKKAIILAPFDEPFGDDSNINNILATNCLYRAKQYVLDNYDWTGKAGVRASLENLTMYTTASPYSIIYDGYASLMVQSWTAKSSINGTPTDAGLGTLSYKTINGYIPRMWRFDPAYEDDTTYNNWDALWEITNGTYSGKEYDNYSMWWYTCVGADDLYASYTTNAPMIQNRVSYWQQFKLGIEGVLYHRANITQDYDGTYTDKTEAELINEGTIYEGAHGDGLLMISVRDTYGAYGVNWLSTLKLENTAEGIDDYNYLAFAQSLIDEISDLTLKAGYQARLDAVYTGLFTKPSDYTKDASVLKASRSALAGLLEDLFA